MTTACDRAYYLTLCFQAYLVQTHFWKIHTNVVKFTGIFLSRLCRSPTPAPRRPSFIAEDHEAHIACISLENEDYFTLILAQHSIPTAYHTIEGIDFSLHCTFAPCRHFY